MTTTLMRPFRLTLVVAGLLALAACGNDTIVQPTFGSGCVVGSLRPGQTLTGVLDASSCQVTYNWYSNNQTPYASYRVSLEKGKGYWFYMQQAPDAEGRNGVDALLTLFGKDANGASVPLAVSDDDAGGVSGYDSEFYFIASKSGSYQLVASAYDYEDVGGYRLTMAECPVLAVLDTVGTYEDLAFRSGDCVRHDLAGGGTPSRIALIGVPAAGSDRVRVEVASVDLYPRIELGGPGFDVFENLYEESVFSSSITSPAVAQVDLQGVGGLLTMAVGSDQLDPAGRLSVELTRTPVALAALRDGGEPTLTLRRDLGRTKRR